MHHTTIISRGQASTCRDRQHAGHGVNDANVKLPGCAPAPRLPNSHGLCPALAFHDSSVRRILTTMSLAYLGAYAGHLDGRIMAAIRDWATPENLQPEPITVEIWRDLPEEFCRQVEVVPSGPVRRQRRVPGGLVPGRRDGRPCATLVPRGTRPWLTVLPRLAMKALAARPATALVLAGWRGRACVARFARRHAWPYCYWTTTGRVEARTAGGAELRRGNPPGSRRRGLGTGAEERRAALPPGRAIRVGDATCGMVQARGEKSLPRRRVELRSRGPDFGRRRDGSRSPRWPLEGCGPSRPRRRWPGRTSVHRGPAWSPAPFAQCPTGGLARSGECSGHPSAPRQGSFAGRVD